MIRKQVFYIVGLILILLGISMFFSAAWSLYFDYYLGQEDDLISFIKSITITISTGIILAFFTSSKEKIELSNRDGFSIVTIGWVVMVVFSALPFYFYGNGFTYVNAFFEAMSGLTTTGATILGKNSISDIESLPHGLLFWRSFTQFIGGMGIIVFSIAILPLLGMGGVQLFRAEVAGPVADKLTPRVKQTAKMLWSIYVGFVLFVTITLWIEGMDIHSAFCHAFTTVATAGFSTKNASIGAFTPLIQWTIIFFMFCAGTSFTLHYMFLSKKSPEYTKDTEFKFYLTMIIIFSLIFFTINGVTLLKFSPAFFI